MNFRWGPTSLASIRKIARAQDVASSPAIGSDRLTASRGAALADGCSTHSEGSTAPNRFTAGAPPSHYVDYTIQYYDVVLLAIAVSLFMGAIIGIATPVTLTAAVVLFGLLAVAFIGHALFVNGPIDEVEDLSEEVDPAEVPGIPAAVKIVE